MICVALLATTVTVFVFSAGYSATRSQRTAVKTPPKAAAKGSPNRPAKSLPMAAAFTMPDADGKSRSLAGYHGHPVTMFFYCGCEWCHRCATDWGQFQRGGALPKDTDGTTPATLIVYSGDASAAKQFSNETGLSAADTVLLPDPKLDVTISKYDAEPCPRVFVVNRDGRIVYTNNHKDDAARSAPEMVIVSRALDALRKTAQPVTSAASATKGTSN